jgi:ABC-type sulfate transport system permease component
MPSAWIASPTPICLVAIVAGLGTLVWGARWFLQSAVDIARSAGIDELVIGLTIVAAGTSLPEVATSVLASFRGEKDIAVGNVVGSNIFNILGVLGVQVAFTELGVIVALTFISLPFVIRTVQPVLEDMSTDLEEAAASLGAGRLITFTQIILPNLKPALLTGLALAFARALGEYGSVVFISGNMPFKTEIIPLLIMTKLEQYDYVGANAIAVMSLLLSFLILIVVNILQRNTNRKD